MRPFPTDLSEIDAFIASNVGRHPTDIARVTASRFGITRQAVNRHIRQLVERRFLRASGATRARRYDCVVLGAKTFVSSITPSLEEDQVWREHVGPMLARARQNVRDVCNYGVTEIVNNAIDHSGSDRLVTSVRYTIGSIQIAVHDEGIGIFRKIRDACGLEDERHAILELSKGKLTTDPERHTGEGIFFTSRMFDEFSIHSRHLSLGYRRAGIDVLIEDTDVDVVGTHVTMVISPWAGQTSQEVFDRYAGAQDDYAFSRTHVVVSLAETETEKLVSRSQAKRVMARLPRFRDVVLDFNRIETIGPAFADEIFRVFRLAHPDVHIRPVNMAPSVEAMVQRALASSSDAQNASDTASRS